jgi:hypothetical protein
VDYDSGSGSSSFLFVAFKMPQIISFFLIIQYLVIASIFKAKKLRVWILEAKTLTDPAVLEHWFQAKKKFIKSNRQSQEFVQYPSNRPDIGHKKVVLTT